MSGFAAAARRLNISPPSVTRAVAARSFSHQVYDHLHSGCLCRVLQPYEVSAVPVHVVYREGLKASLKVRSFVDFAVSYLRRHPVLSEGGEDE
ncbi:hypothetical protein D9M71_116090 [compost metagenome]